MKKLMRFGWVLVLLGFLVAQPGCCTLEHLMDPEQELAMYGGTSDCFQDMEDSRATFFEVLFRILDLPFTIAADTLLLPVTAPVELTR